MARENCKACGKSFSSTFYICPYCGVKRTDKDLLTRVDIAYNAADSEAARRLYNDVLARDRKNAEAYWGLFLLDHEVKDGIFNEGIANIRVTAENYLLMNLTDRLYDSIILNDNYLRASSLAEGELKTRIDTFKNGLERRHDELARESSKPKSKKSADSISDMFKPSSSAKENKADIFGKFDKSFDKSFDSKSTGTSKTTPKKHTTSGKGKTKPAPIKSKISAGSCVAAVICCIPVIIELLAVLLIPHIGFLAENAYISRWGWQALSVPMTVSFLSLIVLGFMIQALGLLGKLNKPLGMVTQIISFGLFVLSTYAAHNNAESAFTQWGMALLVPVSLLVTVLRYLSTDKFGFIDDFNFWYYLPIALEVAEYILFFLVFPLMFDVSASLWAFVALTVTTIAAIGVSSFWEDFHWVSAGINLVVVVLLCLVYWLGVIFSSEWMWNGGIITVVILAIGGSWFIHWFIHRNDP